jgi:hypothetical protein
VPQGDVQVFTFFIDRSLGSGIVATALRGAGETVVIHDTVFDADTADVTWLAEAGKRGWVVLTKDARTHQCLRIRSSPMPHGPSHVA